MLFVLGQKESTNYQLFHRRMIVYKEAIDELHHAICEIQPLIWWIFVDFRQLKI